MQNRELLMSHQNAGMTANVHPYGPDIKAPVDSTPSDSQPPGTDDDSEPQSLEEALTG